MCLEILKNHAKHVYFSMKVLSLKKMFKKDNTLSAILYVI